MVVTWCVGVRVFSRILRLPFKRKETTTGFGSRAAQKKER